MTKNLIGDMVIAILQAFHPKMALEEDLRLS